MSAPTPRRVGFLGPFGTFTDQAARTQHDLAAMDLVPFRTVPDVLDAVEAGEIDLGFVPIENSIEGTVNLTQDALVFDHDLYIQREVVLDIKHFLLALPGTKIADVAEVHSMPVAMRSAMLSCARNCRRPRFVQSPARQRPHGESQRTSCRVLQPLHPSRRLRCTDST